MVMLTDWFPPGVNPMRPGSYITKYRPDTDHWVVCHWSGKCWFSPDPPRLSRNYAIAGDTTPRQMYWWRGLSFDPKLNFAAAAD